ncbi:MAG: sugar transferase [Candidatus Magasanikbacteria bacterium]
MHNRISWKKIYLIVQDLAGFYIGLWLGLALRHFSIPTSSEYFRHLPLFSIIFMIWVVINYINELYDLNSEPESIDFYRKIWESAVFSLIVGIVFFYLLPFKNITPKTILLLVTICGYLIANLFQVFSFKFIFPNTSSQNLLFVGATKEVEELIGILGDDHFFYNVKSIITKKNNTEELPREIKKHKDVSKVKKIIKDEDIDQVILAPHLKGEKQSVEKLYEILYLPVKIKDLNTFYEEITGRVPPSTFKEAWFLDHMRNLQEPSKLWIRRIIDIAFALFLGVITLILFPIIALAIKLESEGPILISQDRVGKENTVFTMYKFRSMYALSEEGLAETDGPQFTKKDDDRVTKVGNLLRKTRLDELPQVWNLLKGDLTLIGPRPERPEISQKLEQKMPYYPLRHIIKPGITSWAVLHQNYTDTLEKSLQKLQYDLFYIKNRSFLLDLSIALRTVNVVVRMMGQ